MIKGIYGLFFTSKPEESRSFLKDKMGLPFTDTGNGWLIFDFEEGDLGVHPTDSNNPTSGIHDISFYTDDIHQTVEEMRCLSYC